MMTILLAVVMLCLMGLLAWSFMAYRDLRAKFEQSQDQVDVAKAAYAELGEYLQGIETERDHERRRAEDAESNLKFVLEKR